MRSIHRHVLAALAQGISKDDDLAARAALGHIDPVLRGPARKRLAAALVDAELVTATSGIARPTRAHVQRLAALALSKQDLDWLGGDPEATAAAYARLPSMTAPRVPWFTLATTAALVAVAASIALYVVTRPGPKSRTYVRRMPPASATAYHDGGVPLHDPALDDVFGTRLTEVVVHTNRARDGAAAELAALRATQLHHGAKLEDAWHDALDAYATAIAAGPQADQDPLREAVRELTEELGKVGQGYFLEGRLKRGVPLIQAYRVEEIVFVVAGGRPLRVLSLRRLDHLNTAYAVLGMHDEDIGDPVLHLDRIDEHVASVELPVLAAGAAYPVAEDGWLASAEGRALSAAIGEAVRREYTAALGPDAAAGARIAALLAERTSIIDEWRRHLDKRHIAFVATDDLFLPPDLLPSLKEDVPHYQQERVEAIEAALAELEAPRIHDRVRALVAATVRRHEAQHAFDFDRDTELRYPEPLADMLGSPHDDEGNEIAIVRSARAELSGYLSQILNDPITPQSALWHLGRQVFTKDRWGTGEFYAGVVVIEGLAHQLGLDVPRGRRFDREALAKLATAIAGVPDARLRAAAGALWQELYGEAPTTIIDAAIAPVTKTI